MKKAHLTGDWAKVEEVLQRLGKSGGDLDRAIKKAVLQEAQAARTEVIGNFNRGGPRDGPWQARSDFTRAKVEAAGGSNKTLIRNADLRNSVTVVQKDDRAFVGVLRTAQGRDGKSLYNIADIHEHGRGPFAVTWSAKARAFLMAMLREAGIEPDPSKSKPHVGQTTLVKIPARPFLQPAYDFLFGDKNAARARFVDRIVKILEGSTRGAVKKRPGGHH